MNKQLLEQIIDQETQAFLIGQFETMQEMGYSEEAIRGVTPEDVFETWYAEVSEQDIERALDCIQF